MTDRPILFSATMVRAILDGRKMQTRRVLKGIEQTESGDWHIFGNGGGAFNVREEFVPRFAPDYVAYSPGDRLWVREAWRSWRWNDELSPSAMPTTWAKHPDKYVSYIANGSDERMDGRFRQSMHMPRWASRLTLIVTGVRVQRLKEISEADATDEGCFKGRATGRVFENATAMRLGGDEWANAKDWFADLWDGLNAKRGYGWHTNPWVVAVTFLPIKQNIDEVET